MSESKLTYKIELQYSLDNNKKVIFINEIHSDGLEIQTTSVGNNKIIEKKIKGRVLSGECLIDGVLYGFEYILDDDQKTIDLKPKNKNISINDSVNTINMLKNSEDFNKVKMSAILANNDSCSFIAIPSQNFIVYREVELYSKKNKSIYFHQQNFSCINNGSILDSEEECYQINDDHISFTTDFKNNDKSFFGNIDNIEIENKDEADTVKDTVQSIIDNLEPLKKILVSHPKSYKDLNIGQEKKNPLKKI